jgi:hypothetical protein
VGGFVSRHFKLTLGVWIPGLRQDGASRNDERDSREHLPDSIFKQPRKATRPRILAARCARVVASTCPRKNRGRSATPRGEQGMPDARRVRSRVRSEISTRVSHHGHAGNVRHSPRNGFNGFLRALLGDRACLPPSPPRSLLPRSLTPASGRQDHTASPSVAASFVRAKCLRCDTAHVHRIPHQRP